MPTALASLKQVTQAILPLSEEDWAEFEKMWKPFSAKRKEILTVAGEKEKYLYFNLCRKACNG